VQDAAWIWAILSGQPVGPVVSPEPGSIRLCRLTGYFAALVGDVRVPFEGAIADLKLRGVSVRDAELTRCDAIAATYVNMVLPEAAHWHARFLDTQAANYTPNVKARLEMGRTIAAVDYLKARETRIALRQAIDARLADCDALVLPTLPIVAPLIGAQEVVIANDRAETVPVRTAMLKHTQVFNLTGHPAISLPVRTPGLPVGLQLVGARDQTAKLLAIAAAIEKIVSSPA
jgi:aspartyl-tRNA(Asn)/glutamyl-tRNA(Gln) amidotransferase subunit A